jgi:hypothetical protein
MYRPETNNWTIRGELMVSFFPAGPIAKNTWQDYCDTIAGDQVRRVLATSLGVVEVDAEQRKQIHVALRLDPRVSAAVVTDEPIVRGLMIATAWLGRIDAKAFAWDDLAAAYRFLEPQGISEQEVLDLVDVLRRRVSADPRAD